MSDEIKEILQKIENVANRETASRNALMEMKDKDYQLLLDCITNLQQENDKLNNIINQLEKVLNYDIDKSKEYMKKIINSGLEQGDYPIHYYRAEWQKEKAIGYLDKLKELKEGNNAKD